MKLSFSLNLVNIPNSRILYIFIHYDQGLLTAHNELATTHARLATTHYELHIAHARLAFLDFALVVISCPSSSPFSSLFFIDLLDLL
jgi:hypothetical protein